MRVWRALKENPWLGGGVAIVIIAMAVWRPWRGSSHAASGRWYYDLAAGQLVVADAEGLPPVVLPSGNQGVAAYVYACGDCRNEQFIGYLERYTDQGKQNATQEWRPEQGGTPPVGGAGVEVAAEPVKGEAPKWVPMMSPVGVSIQNVSTRCPGGKTVTCLPK